MEFELTKTQKEIQKAVRDFCKGEFDKDLALELDQKHEYPTKIWQKAGEIGLIGVHFPEEYSGQGMGCLECILVVEELCRNDSTMGACVALSGFSSELVMHYGSEALKKRFLPEVAEGRMLSAGAFYRAGPRIGYHLPEHHRRQRRRRMADQRRQDLYYQRGHGRVLQRAVPD